MLKLSLHSKSQMLLQASRVLQNSTTRFRPAFTTCTAHFSIQTDLNPARYKRRTNDGIQISDSTAQVRLSKRMSELGICSRREAAQILKDTTEATDLMQFKQVIYLRGEPATKGTGMKVAQDEKFIEIRSVDDMNSDEECKTFVPYDKLPWDKICGDTIVLNKPVGYVSGQEEHQHVPAVRLLTQSNLHIDEDDTEIRKAFTTGSVFNYSRKKWNGFDFKTSSVPKPIKDKLGLSRKNKNDSLGQNTNSFIDESTLSGYAPAGRLDIDSTGILIFTRAGIMARRLIAPDSNIPKEYIVKVQHAIQPTARERKLGLLSLPSPNKNLGPLLRGGTTLWNDTKPLDPLVEAEWLGVDTLRLVLQEGRKRQIRRMCREILGMHVVSLVRTSIGPVKLGSLPEGKWRPLRKVSKYHLMLIDFTSQELYSITSFSCIFLNFATKQGRRGERNV
ncbi:hypothetical protein HJC23_001725 [Cyclotella cryptica]|uniref:Pseudouridine synthase RsuA/RluA-like domain-containing protein n=1 Tax=Cyclotella cryptica TaxID=29204 RepID=A0ABD3QT36_9STRA|eukprot:CCRYP_003258-RA/>CCRYP_003258-RA protein AED:0.00 eAED:0.00 QI:243/-1/1/1/-1/1/1/231/446